MTPPITPHIGPDIYRSLFHAMDLGFCIVEVMFNEEGTASDYRFLEVNPVFAVQTGLPDALGKTARSLLPNLEMHWFRHYGEVAHSGRPATFVEHSEVMGRWFEVYAYPVEPLAARMVAILFKDITEQRRIQEALRASEERYHNFLQSSSEGIWRFEVDAPIPAGLPTSEQIDLFFERGYLAECNDAMARMYGYEKAEELTGVRLDAFFPRDEATLAYFTHFIESGYRIENAESREVDRWGGVHYFSNNLVGIFEGGWLLRAWGTQRDVTAQRLAEEQLRENEHRLEGLVQERTRELHRSNEDLQQFAHVASHDLKEPIRKITTFASRLEDEEGARLEERGKMYLRKIQSAAERMQQMIDGVLSYSTLNASIEEPEPVDLNSVLRHIEADLEVPIATAGARIQYGRLPVVEGSAVLLYQLFYNLLGNSIKFARPGVPPQIRITTDSPEGEGRGILHIHVQDNGIGFPADQGDAIFETFTRLNSKDQYEGTGLGLALCKKIVERHGGTIRGEGVPGQGARFTVALPMRQGSRRL